MSRVPVLLCCALLVAACSGGGGAAPTTHGTVAPPDHDTTTVPHGGGVPSQPWTMFRRDPPHTAVVPGVGAIDPVAGPVERWRYRLSEPSQEMRWFATFPLGDLDGDGDLEVVVTSADLMPGVGPRAMALTAEGELLWTFEVPDPEGWVDQYGSALADADGDGLLDVVFTSRDGYIRAVSGLTGELIWRWEIGRIMESGPMIADLDGDGTLEVVQVTDCLLGTGCAPSGELLVFAADPVGEELDNAPLWNVEFPWKVDSGEPAIVDLDPGDGRDLRQIVFGGWGGRLMVIWRSPGGDTVVRDLVLASLDPGVPDEAETVAMRTSPLIVDFGDGLTAVFGWMPDYKDYRDARLSAVSITVSTEQGTADFIPRWTQPDDAWKSSPALLEVDGRRLIVTGAGYALGGFGPLACNDVAGRYLARDGRSGELAWTLEMPAGQGDPRGSVAVADVDGDGANEVVAGIGCGGRLVALDGATGAIEWERQLGTNTYVSPSLADLDGDGFLEIVVGSQDGYVYAFGG
jgi:outer membrane protein assembly factor BamB